MTQAALARTLGITRQALNWHLKNSDAPPVGDVKAWIQFLAENGREGSAPANVRRKIAERRLEILDETLIDARRKNAEAAGRMLDAGEVRTAVLEGVATLFGETERLFVNELPPALAGLDAVTIRMRAEDAITKVKSAVREKLKRLLK